MEIPNVTDFINDPEIVLLIMVLLANITGFIKGWVVPKAVYEREVARGDKATESLAAFSKTIESLTEELRSRRSDG